MRNGTECVLILLGLSFVGGCVADQSDKPVGATLVVTTDTAMAHPPTAKLQLTAAEHFKQWAVLESNIRANSWLTRTDIHGREWLEQFRLKVIRALEYRPDIARDWRALGQVCYKLGRYSEAVSAYKTCLAMDPEVLSAGFYYDIALSNAYVGDYETAANMMREAYRQKPSSSAYYKWLVVFSFGHGGLEAAAEVWREKNPNTFKRSGEFYQAEYKAFNLISGGIWSLAKEAKRIEAHYAELKHHSKLFALESVLAWRHFHEEAPSWLGPGVYNERERKALDGVCSAYGKLAVKPAPPPDAVRCVVEAQAHMKSSLSFFAFMGKKRWDEAEACYRKSIVIAPWWPEVHYNAALLMSHKRSGLAVAVIEMELYLQLVPDGDRADTARSKIQEWREAIQDYASEGLGIRDDGRLPSAPDVRHY